LSSKGDRNGRLSDCLAYRSVNDNASSETLLSCDIWYRSAEPSRPKEVNGGDWLAMTGSEWPIADNGETDGATFGALTIGERYGMLYCALKFAAGIFSGGWPDVKNAGVPYSDGEFAVVADIGYWR